MADSTTTVLQQWLTWAPGFYTRLMCRRSVNYMRANTAKDSFNQLQAYFVTRVLHDAFDEL